MAHLWTNENINSFITYTSDQKDNNIVLLKASEILCTLSQNSNVYFYFVFNTKDNLKLQEEQSNEKESGNKCEKNLVDNKVLKNLIETNVFHNDRHIAYNFCLFSTTLLVFQSKNIRKLNNERKSLLESGFILDSSHLFELSKNGLFAIILECNKKLSMAEQDSDKINLLKVCTVIFLI